jgi:hypothetical protein
MGRQSEGAGKGENGDGEGKTRFDGRVKIVTNFAHKQGVGERELNERCRAIKILRNIYK